MKNDTHLSRHKKFGKKIRADRGIKVVREEKRTREEIKEGRITIKK